MSTEAPGPAGLVPGRGTAIRVLVVAFVAWFLTNVDQSLFAYAVPQLRKDFGLDLTEISYIVSLSFIAGIFVPIFVGMATDRHGPRWTLPMCLGFSALLVGMQGLMTDVGIFATARVASFGLSAALSPITAAMVLSAAPVRWRAMSVAILQCAYPLGWFVSSLIVAPLIETMGWRPLFFVGFAIAPLAVVLGLMLPRGVMGARSDKPARAPVMELFRPLHLRTTLLCAAGFFFNSGAVAATAFYLPTFLNEVRGYGVGDSALIVGIGYGVGIIGYIGSAWVSTHLLSRRDTIVLWNLLAAGLFIAWVWLPVRMGHDMVGFGLLSIFYFGTSAILITFVLEAFPPHLRNTAAAVCGTAAVSASMASFPVLVAQMVPGFGWQMTFSLVVPPALLLSAAAIIGVPRERGGQAGLISDEGGLDAASAHP